MRRALVVRGGWQGHAPVETTELFVPFLARHGFHVTTAETLEVYEDAGLMAATDLIVQCWTTGELTPKQSAGLTGAVHAGTGLAGWHGGIVDAFRGDLGYQMLTGGQFVTHPPGFVRHRINLVASRAYHAIVAGLGDFEVHTEQYWVTCDPMNDVLATTTFEADEIRPLPTAIPAVWTRTVGSGRVFVSTIGHKLDDFDVLEVRAITERGLLWASR